MSGPTANFMTMKALTLMLAATVLAVPALAQTPSQLKAELRSKETAAKQDPDAMFDAAKWAQGKGLAAEARRIFQAILKQKPDHEGANLALGNELVEGKWLPAKEAEAARKRLMEAEAKAKGLVEVGGVYVEKDQVDDAKKGIFHHDGQLVSRKEMLLMLAGRVRHPVTGELIAAADLDKANQGQFPIGGGRWVDAKEANSFHQDTEHPWLYRTSYYTLISTLPVETLDKVKIIVDQAYESVSKFLGGVAPTPAHRPIVFVAATVDEFKGFGQGIGDETSSYGAFLTREEARVNTPYQEDARAAVCNWGEKGNWGEYYAMHAAGMAYLGSLLQDLDTKAPLWFEEGFGSYASRFRTGRDAGYFGEQHVAKGGVKDLKAWFNSFAISAEVEVSEINYNVFQAGLVLSFAASGANAKVTDAMLEVTRCFKEGKGKNLEKAIDKLQKQLIGTEPELRAYLQKLIANKDR